MGVQLDDFLTYRGNQYRIKQSPLKFYSDNNNGLDFTDSSSKIWNKYLGFWLLKDKFLYLTNFCSDGYSFNEIFNSYTPVLADWYSGYISFGIDSSIFDKWDTSYEYNVWISIVEGEVRETKIIKNFQDEIFIDSGKFKGRRVDELMYGKISTILSSKQAASSKQYSLEQTIRDFIETIVESICLKTSYCKILGLHFPNNEENKELITFLHEREIPYQLSNKYLCFDRDTGDLIYDTKMEQLSSFFEKLLSNNSDYSISSPNSDFYKNPESAESAILINPDFHYLDWAIKNIESFCILPHLISKPIKNEVLKKFEIERFNSTSLKYNPIVETEDYRFSNQTLYMNQIKFEKIHSVKFDNYNEVYFLDFPIDEMVKEYGFYLDEFYIPSTSVITSNEMHFESDNDDYKYRYSYDKYGGPSGYDDDSIDSAFEGNPENTSNIE